MARISATTDTASALLETTLASVATSASQGFAGGEINFAIFGTFVATIQIEMSFDNGTTWLPVQDSTFTTRTFTAPANGILLNTEPNVLFRFNMTAYTSGTANVRMSCGARRA